MPRHTGGIALALACHKGDAKQQQTSTQTGAQTSGVAATGNNNIGNSGNQIVIGSANNGGEHGSRARGAANAPAGNVTATIENGISGADLAAFGQTVLAQLKANATANNATTTSGTAGTSGTPDPNTAPPTDSTNPDGTPVKKPNWAAISAVCAIAGTGYLIFRTRKKS